MKKTSLKELRSFSKEELIRYATGDCFVGFCPLPKLLQGLRALGQGT